MWIARTTKEACRARAALERRVALVATMGALHAGHLSLIERARAVADHCVVSIFVNPTQFGPNEDFKQYPRPIEQDLEMCRQANVDGVFCPCEHDLYPPAQVPSCVTVPALAGVLEGEYRPSHFAGVCRVVLKLLNIVRPQISCFGQKDYQQLKIVEAVCADLSVPVQIVPCPTVRDLDGLALSSRNQTLAAPQRAQALGLVAALRRVQALVEQEDRADPAGLERAMSQTMAEHDMQIDYAVLRHPQTLALLPQIDAQGVGAVALVAGRVASVRLVDSMLIGRAAGTNP